MTNNKISHTENKTKNNNNKINNFLYTKNSINSIFFISVLFLSLFSNISTLSFSKDSFIMGNTNTNTNNELNKIETNFLEKLNLEQSSSTSTSTTTTEGNNNNNADNNNNNNNFFTTDNNKNSTNSNTKDYDNDSTEHTNLFNTPYPSDPTYSSNIVDTVDPTTEQNDDTNPPDMTINNSTNSNQGVEKEEEKKPDNNEPIINNSTETQNATTFNETKPQEPSKPNNTTTNNNNNTSTSTSTSTTTTTTSTSNNNNNTQSKNNTDLNNNKTEVKESNTNNTNTTTTKPLVAPKEEESTDNNQTKQTTHVATRVQNIDQVVIKETCTNTLNKINEQYGTKPINLKRYYTTLWVIVFGTIYLTLRLLLAFHRRNSDVFIKSSINSLCTQCLFLFICLSFSVLFVYLGWMDTWLINWEAVLNGIGMFIVFWILFNLAMIYLTFYTSIKTFRNYEKKIKNYYKQDNNKKIFTKEINSNEDNNNNNNNNEEEEEEIDLNSITSNQDTCLYYKLRSSFTVPTYPSFKCNTYNNEDFEFSTYLEFFIIRTYKSLFKLSWYTLTISVFMICFWAVCIAPGSSAYKMVVCLFLIPICQIICMILAFFYLKSKLGKIVENNQNELFYNNQKELIANKQQGTPVYLNLIKEEESKGLKVSYDNRNEFKGSVPTHYDDVFFGGNTGFYLIINGLQLTIVTFLAVTVLFLFLHLPQFLSSSNTNKEEKGLAVLFIIIWLVYIALVLFLSVIILKWYNLLNNIEQLRNEDSVEKTLQYMYKNNADISQKTIQSFKVLYFYIHKYGLLNNKNNENNQDLYHTEINSLKQRYNKYIDLLFINFKTIKVEDKRFEKQNEKDNKELIVEDLENYPIHPEELHSFFKSAGNNIKQDDIDLMKRFIEFNEKDNDGKITHDQFREIWALMIYFSTQKVEHVLFYVFSHHFSAKYSLEEGSHVKDMEIDHKALEEMLVKYEEFFTKKEVEYLKRESRRMNGEKFSIGEFVYVIVAARKYHAI